ncbi:MAG: LUD domain-containing protein [Thermodesulfobacteriota bacterium]
MSNSLHRRQAGTAAIRAATHRALAARDRLVQEYPDWDTWRRQAREIKTRTLDSLEDLLAQFQQAVRGWGGEVLWARDGAEARGLILEVARKHGVQEVVKAKSMTTEEIALNPHLTAAGLQVTETDLGEFIVQLAGQLPAHITAPALHLDRYQIARLFAEHLGLSCPPDPLILCRTAAEYLKPRYAAAQMGITGVNFGAVAEGALVLIENEGNLRQCATRPPVHLALMGMEKLIPALADLQFLLPLLPASATGQRLTALVHFLRGLKTGPQGRQAFYLVILDNGRSLLAAEPELREALFCLRCGACLNICPIFQEGAAHLYGRVYPGAIGILLAPFLAPRGDISDLCSQCGACEELCPAGIHLPEKIRYLRRHSPRFRRLRAVSRLAGFTLNQPWLYRQLETGLRRLEKLVSPDAVKSLWGVPFAPSSFYAGQERLENVRGRGNTNGGQPPPAVPDLDRRGRLSSPKLGSLLHQLETRLAEVDSVLHQVQGPQTLARLLAERAGTPLWLEDHPLLQPLLPDLANLGIPARQEESAWAPEADTVVSVGLGAVPATGSVLVPGGTGPGYWLPFRAKKQLVLVPPERAGLSLAQALELTPRAGTPLVTWLTGPTRTADIEKVLVLGAQGPGELEVAVYGDRETA